MLVLRTFVPNSAENYNHLVYCPETRQAAAVDPFDGVWLAQKAEQHGLSIKAIWITHEHGDHIRDIDKMVQLSSAPVYAPESCRKTVPADHYLADNVTLSLGHGNVVFRITPGHTPGHGVYFYSGSKQYKPFVICADTLFNAGVGNVISGDVYQLYQTVNSLKQTLSNDTVLYPGHDYLCNNLRFVLHYFPNHLAASQTLAKAEVQSHDSRLTTTMAEELTFNPFLALSAPWVANHPDLAALSEEERFVQLRQWRNQW